MLFGVSDWIRDITRRSGIVWRIRFIYWGSFSKLGNVPECLYGDSRRFQNVLEGSRRFLRVFLKTKKGSRKPCGARGLLPPSQPAGQGGRGVLLGLPLPWRLPPLNRGEGAPPPSSLP